MKTIDGYLKIAVKSIVYMLTCVSIFLCLISTPFAHALTLDLNGDGLIDAGDFLAISAANADADSDGVINEMDIILYLDINCDGVVDNKDLQLIKHIVTMPYPVNSEIIIDAWSGRDDLDGNGKVEYADRYVIWKVDDIFESAYYRGNISPEIVGRCDITGADYNGTGGDGVIGYYDYNSVRNYVQYHEWGYTPTNYDWVAGDPDGDGFATGDVDHDGDIDWDDVYLVNTAYYMESNNITFDDIEKCDLNNDGKVTYNEDYQLLLTYEYIRKSSYLKYPYGTEFALPDAYTTDGWIAQNQYSLEDFSAGAIGIAAGETAYMERVIELAENGVLSFKWTLSGYSTDHLKLYVDGELIEDITYYTYGTEVAVNLTAGAHTVKWVFDRTGTTYSYGNYYYALVDQIKINGGILDDFNPDYMARFLEFFARADMNGDGFVDDRDLAVGRSIIGIGILIENAKKRADEMVFDSQEGYVHDVLEDYIKLGSYDKLENGNYLVIITVDNFEFHIEMRENYDFTWSAIKTEVIDTTGTYPEKIKQDLMELFNCSESEIEIYGPYDHFYNVTDKKATWNAYLHIGNRYIYVNGAADLNNLSTGIDRGISAPIIRAKEDIGASLGVQARDIKITDINYNYVEAEAGGLTVQYYFYYDSYQGRLVSFELNKLVNGSGRDLVDAAKFYLANLLGTDKYYIDVARYWLNDAGNVRFTLIHDQLAYEIDVNVGTGEVVITDPGEGKARELVVQDALKRDWNLKAPDEIYPNSPYYFIGCTDVYVKIVKSIGNGLYYVKAEITVEDPPYGTTRTKDVEYIVDVENGVVTAFELDPDNIKVEIKEGKEIVSYKSGNTEYQYEVTLNSEGKRTKQVGTITYTYNGYNYTLSRVTTWERIFDAEGKYPLRYTATKEERENDVIKSYTRWYIYYGAEGAMKYYSKYYTEYDADGKPQRIESDSYSYFDNGQIQYEYHYDMYYWDYWIWDNATGTYTIEKRRQIDSYSYWYAYDDTGYRRKIGEYKYNITVNAAGLIIDYYYRYITWDLNGTITYKYELDYDRYANGQYNNYMLHRIYKDWRTGNKIDDYQSRHYNESGVLVTEYQTKYVYNDKGKQIEYFYKSVERDNEGNITSQYLDHYKYWDDGKTKWYNSHDIWFGSVYINGEYVKERHEEKQTINYYENGYTKKDELLTRVVTNAAGLVVENYYRYQKYNENGGLTYKYETKTLKYYNGKYKQILTHRIYFDSTGKKIDYRYQYDYAEDGTLERIDYYSYVYFEDGSIQNSYDYDMYYQNVYVYKDDGTYEIKREQVIYSSSYWYGYNESGVRKKLGEYVYNLRRDEGAVYYKDYYYKYITWDYNGNITYKYERDYEMYDKEHFKHDKLHRIYTDYTTKNKIDDYSYKTYHENGKLKTENLTKSVRSPEGVLLESHQKNGTYDQEGNATYLYELHDWYRADGKYEKRYEHYITIDYYGVKTDKEITTNYDEAGKKTTCTEDVDRYDAEGLLTDNYLLYSQYNNQGILTYRTARIEVVKPADQSGISSTEKYYYSAQYDISDTGYILYTHVYDVLTGKEIAELSGQGYITPATIIDKIHDLINQAEIQTEQEVLDASAEVEARLALEAEAQAQTDIDNVTVVNEQAKEQDGILTP